MKALKQVLNFSHFSQLYLELGICSNAVLDWTTIPQSQADLYVCDLYQWTFFVFLITIRKIRNSLFSFTN